MLPHSYNYATVTNIELIKLLVRLRSGGAKLGNYALNFYELNYDIVSTYFHIGQRRHFLRSDEAHTCRFCGGRRSDGRTTFKKKAHAITRFLGNKLLFTTFECDSCNELFSIAENDFGNYTKPYRTLSRMSGYRGVPEIRGPSSNWRISADPIEVDGGINVIHNQAERIFQINDDTNTGTFSIPRDPYIPLNIFKMLVRTAIVLMPDTELCNFEDTIEWLVGNASFTYQPALIGETFVDGWRPLGGLSALVLKRKWPTREIPYSMLILSFGNYAFQISIPSPKQDAHLNGHPSAVPPFPTSHEVFPSRNRIHHEIRDFSQNTRLEGDRAVFHFAFAERTKIAGNKAS